MKNIPLTLLFLFILFGDGLFAQQKNEMLFLENVGQIHDQFGKPRKDIDFVLQSKGMNIFISKGKLTYQFADETLMQRLEAELIGSSSKASLEPEQATAYYENHHFAGKLLGIAHSYKKIVYRNIYPHIDWILKINADNTFEYEYAVGALGNANQIQMKYNGAEKISINTDGDLIVQTNLGNIKEKAPTTYGKAGAIIPSHYTLNNNKLSYDTNPYTGALVIDPKVVWASFYGDSTMFVSGTTSFVNVVYNGKGCIYASGATNDIVNIATIGAYQTSIKATTGSKADGFFVKMDTNGNRLYASYFGAIKPIGGCYICLHNDTVYLSGGDISNTLGTTGVAQSSFAPFYSAPFLAKFSPSGSLMWCTYVGANYKSGTSATCFVDQSNNIYALTANDTFSSFVATAGAHKTVQSGGLDAVIIKYNSQGQKIWGTYIGGKKDDAVSGAIYMENDLTGALYVLGSTYSDSGIATSGAFHSTLSSAMDAMLIKFDTSGNRIWGTYIGGDSTDNAQSITQDGHKNIYISGFTNSKTNIATTGAYQSSLGDPLGDMFLMKFNVGGNRIWGTYFGGEKYDVGYGLSNDSSGNVFICGSTESMSNIADTGAFQKTIGGNDDGFLAAFSPTGKKMWSSYYGGEGAENLRSLCSDNKNIYCVGSSNSKTKNIATKGGFLDTNANGNQKGIILKINGAQENYYKDTLSGINTFAATQACTLYPNPNKGIFTFEFKTSSIKKTSLTILDAMGRKIWKQSFNADTDGSLKQEINMHQYPSGLYFLQYETDEFARIVSFIKE